MSAGANRNCPMFNASSIGPSPVGTTPTAAVAGGYGAKGYGEMLSSDPGTSFKIRLGTGSRS